MSGEIWERKRACSTLGTYTFTIVNRILLTWQTINTFTQSVRRTFHQPEPHRILYSHQYPLFLLGAVELYICGRRLSLRRRPSCATKGVSCTKRMSLLRCLKSLRKAVCLYGLLSPREFTETNFIGTVPKLGVFYSPRKSPGTRKPSTVVPADTRTFNSKVKIKR